MKVSSYTTVTQRANPSQSDKYKALIWKFIKLGLSDWLKFQEQLKKLYSTNTCQSAIQPKSKEATINTHK